jgi:hypothetical protein
MMIPFRLNPRGAHPHEVPSPLMPGIILTFPPLYPGYSESQQFFPATLLNITKTHMEYRGDGRGLRQIKFVQASYGWSAKSALPVALTAPGNVGVELVTVTGDRVPKDLNWLERAARDEVRSERHHQDVPQHIRDAAR